MEQPERMEMSGKIISTLINARGGSNKQLNLLQIVKDSLSDNKSMSIERKKSDNVTSHDAQVQTLAGYASESKTVVSQDPKKKINKEADKVERFFAATKSEHPTAIPDF